MAGSVEAPDQFSSGLLLEFDPNTVRTPLAASLMFAPLRGLHLSRVRRAQERPLLASPNDRVTDANASVTRLPIFSALKLFTHERLLLAHRTRALFAVLGRLTAKAAQNGELKAAATDLKRVVLESI